jgi:hypothetical protein
LPLSEDECSALRGELLDSGLFRESGKWTLKANLESETLEQISKVYDLLLKKVDNIVKANSSQ